MRKHIKVDFTFATKIAAELGELSLRRQTVVLRKGVSGGSEVVKQSAKQRAAKDTGALRQSITKKVKVYRDGDTLIGMVGPDTRYYDAGRAIKRETGETRGEYRDRLTNTGKKRPIRYAHFVEYGVAGKPAQPFLRPALDENIPQVKDQIAESCKEAIRKEFETLSK